MSLPNARNRAGAQSVSVVLRFRDFELDPATGRLSKSGVPLRFAGQPKEVLLLLLERPGETVTREQVQERLWGTEVVVDYDAAINTAIKKIRQVLDDDASDPRFLETIPRLGYRFICPVQRVLPVALKTSALPEGTETEAHSQKAAPAAASSWLQSRLRWVLVAASCAAIVIGAWLAKRFDNSGQEDARFHVQPLTRLPHDAYRAGYSPDGSRVVFCWGGYENGAETLWIKQVNGNALMHLTTEGRDEFPAWSPDGRSIGFVRSLKDVMIIPSLGGAERKIAETRTYYLSWMPDSSGLIVGTFRPGTYDVFDYDAISIETGKRTRLTSSKDQVYGYQPVGVSPDGRMLGFTHRPQPGKEAEIYARPLAGGPAIQLSHFDRHLMGWTWTPDSLEIIFAANPDGYYTLWRVRADGSTPAKQVQSNASGSVENPFMVPLTAQRTRSEGQLLGFESLNRKSNFHELDLLPLNGPGRLRATVHLAPLLESSAEDHSLSFSPNAKRAAFISDRTGFSELWLANGFSGDAIQLTSLGRGGDYPYSPSWSNDGAKIAFEVEHGYGVPAFAEPGQETSRIMELSVDGGTLQEIANVALNVRPTWSRDDKWIYFGSRRGGNWQLWRRPASVTSTAHDAGSDGSEEMTTQGAFEAFESLDGKYLFYKKSPSDEDLWMMPIGSQGELLENGATKIITGGVFPGWWAPGGNGIFFADISVAFKGQHLESEPKPIYYFDLRTRRRVQIGAIDHHLLFYLADLTVSRDGGRLVYSQIDFHNINLEMVRNFH